MRVFEIECYDGFICVLFLLYDEIGAFYFILLFDGK